MTSKTVAVCDSNRASELYCVYGRVTSCISCLTVCQQNDVCMCHSVTGAFNLNLRVNGNNMATSKRRFAEYNEEERQCIVDEKDSKNTKTVIKQSIGVLTTYAHARGFTLGQIEQFSSSDLAEILRKM